MRLAAHAALALVLQLGVLVYLDAVGWVRPIVPWDDIAFIERALVNIERAAATEGLFVPALHAPLADFQVWLGLRLFDLNAYGAYLLNAAFLAAGTLFVARWFRREPPTVRWLATLALLLFGPTFLLATELKSDHKGGLFLLIALLLLFEPGKRTLGSARRVAAIAASFVIVLASKTTAVYLPPVVVGIVGLHALRAIEWSSLKSLSLLRVRLTESRPELARYAALLGLVGIGYASMVVPQWDHLKGYVRWALSEKWDVPGTGSSAHVLYYTPFGTTGRLWAIHATLTLLALGYAARRHGLLRAEGASVVAFGVVQAVLWVPLLQDTNYNDDFGTFAYFNTLAAGLFALRFVSERRAEPLPRWLVAGVPLLLVATFQNPIGKRVELEGLPGGARALGGVSEAVHVGRGRRVAFVFDSVSLPHPNLTYDHYRAHGELLVVDRIDTYEDALHAHERFDWIVALEGDDLPGLVDLPQWTANRRGEELVRHLDATAGVTRVAAYPVAGARLLLYASERARR